jgi:hypothetical protein
LVSLQLQFWIGDKDVLENKHDRFWSGSFVHIVSFGIILITYLCIGMLAYWQGNQVYYAYVGIFIASSLLAYRNSRKIDNKVTGSKEVNHESKGLAKKVINFFMILAGLVIGIGSLMMFILSWAFLTR